MKNLFIINIMKTKKRTRFDCNEIFIHGKECEMYLYDRKGKYKMSTWFDIQDLDKVKKYKWHSMKDKNTFYVKVGSSGLLLHQVILPTKKPLVIDHKDYDGLNNRRSNLRSITNRQNIENSRRNKDKYPGVDFFKRTEKWRSRIYYNEKHIHLGYFDTSVKAFKVRQEFKKENNIK